MTQNEHVYAICCRPEVVCDVTSDGNVKTLEGYAMLNFQVASFSSFRDIQKNNFVTAVAADIDDSIKRKRIRISLRNLDSVACRLVAYSISLRSHQLVGFLVNSKLLYAVALSVCG